MLTQARVAVLGDSCLDVYRIIDPDESELSVETHLPVRLVRQQQYSLGDAGNVITNLVDRGVKQIYTAIVSGVFLGEEPT